MAYETDLRAAELSHEAVQAGLEQPLRFRAENESDATELVWSHINGRLSVYVTPGGGFSIEDIPYGEVEDADVDSIPEVIEILLTHRFIKSKVIHIDTFRSQDS